MKEYLATKAKGRGMTRLSRSTLRFRPAPDVPVLSRPGPAEAIGWLACILQKRDAQDAFRHVRGAYPSPRWVASAQTGFLRGAQMPGRVR